jgi:D-alanine-D-alanine ligase-like ATP-grasp enzyme
MKILVLDKTLNGNEPQLAISFHIYETLLSLGLDCIYHTIRSIADMEQIIEKLQFDKIFLCTINDWGNNGTLQRVLDYHSIDYTFSNGEVSFLCYDKSKTKAWLSANGYPIAATYTKDTVKFPCVLKTVEGESSQGVFFITSQSELDSHTSDYLLEEYLGSTWSEYTVSLLNGIVGNPVLIKKEAEILNHKTDTLVFDYQEKNSIRQLIASDFAGIYQKSGIRDACRIDFMVKGSEYKILEINSMPVITPNSVFTASMTDYSSAINYTAIINQIALTEKTK